MRRAGLLCLLGSLLLVNGCHRARRTRSAPKSDKYADTLKPIVESKKIRVMHWPDFADFQAPVQKFYDDRNFEVAWVDDNGKPSAQARAFIQAFDESAKKGLIPADYDAGLWGGRVAKLAGRNEEDVATFDAAMTVSVMRYISDLRLGRVNPTHFNFDIHTTEKKYDLAEFVSDNAVDVNDVAKLIGSVEPDSEAYRRLEAALGTYVDLEKKQESTPALQQPLPTVAKTVAPGASYAAAAALAARLQLEGDMPAADAPAAGSAVYSKELADGVKRYQERHGLTTDGKLTAATIASLNVPMKRRMQQISDSLERWRWLPDEYVNAPLVVNLPEFVLRGYSNGEAKDHALDFTMKVVVGKVVGEHQTPVFTHEMKYLIFRPFWNVPVSIIKKELTEHIQKSGVGYLATKNFETVDRQGRPVNATAEQVEHGGVIVREKPGPKNSLGLIKFMFPNEYDIYLHSTPQPELFERTRRDFSHGCVRVQKPDELAVWVLAHGQANPGDWDLEKVQEAMNSGEDNKTVGLKKPLPIVIFYLTANVEEDGDIHFFDDIYNYDKQLEDVLAKGRPYPSNQVKVNPNAVVTPGDTT